MGKVASDKCHKWVFKEPTENEPNVSNYWQSSFDAVYIFMYKELEKEKFWLYNSKYREVVLHLPIIGLINIC